MAIKQSTHESSFAELRQENSAVVQPQVQPDVQQQAQSAQPFQPYVAQSQPQAQPQPQVQAGYNFNPYAVQAKQGGLLGRNHRLVPYNPVGAKVQSFLEAFNKIAKEFPELEQDRKNWEFLTFDGASNQSLVSAILFVRRSGDMVAVYPWIVQDVQEVLPEKTVNIQGRGGPALSFNVPQLVEELLTSDGVLADRIAKYVLSQARYAGCNVVLTGGLVLPTELEATNEDQLRRVLFYASDTLENTVYSSTGQLEPFSMGYREQDERLSLKLNYRPGQSSTSVGFPVRNAYSVQLFVTRDQNKQSFGDNPRAQFSTARLYPELIYLGDAGPMANANPYMPYPQYRPLFQPAVVISSMDNQFAGATLETQLLALSSVAALTWNNNWMGLFQPNQSIQEVGQDPEDVGMITADVNYPGEQTGYTPTKTADFNLAAFLNKYLTQTLMIRMDVNELGELTPIQRVFLNAAGCSRNGNDQPLANAKIEESANWLTCGNFSRHWASNAPIVVNDVGRVERGYYINDRGEMRDLAEIDYLYLLNKVGVDQARDFQDSFNPAFGSELERFAKRKRIYDTYFAGYKIIGFSQRLTFNPDFIIALSKGLQDVMGPINIETQFHTGVTVERGYRNQLLGVPLGAINQFTHGGYGYNNGGFGGGAGAQWRSYNGGMPNYY